MQGQFNLDFSQASLVPESDLTHCDSPFHIHGVRHSGIGQEYKLLKSKMMEEKNGVEKG